MQRYPIRSSGSDSDDECRPTINESRTNRNVNKSIEIVAKLFSIPQSELKTKMQEYSTSQSASVDYDVTCGSNHEYDHLPIECSTHTARCSGADSTDDRGRLPEELIEENSLVVLNTGAGTFVRPTGEMRHLDIAMASASISRNAGRHAWQRPSTGRHHRQQPRCRRRKFSTALDRKADWKGLKDDCKRLRTDDIITDDVTTNSNHVVSAIPQGAGKKVPVYKPSKYPTRKPVPYWTDECTAAVKERNNPKNKMQQTRDLTDRRAYYKLNGIVKDAKKEHG